MNKEEKQIMDKFIESQIKRVTEDKSPANAAMYVRGDGEFNSAFFCIEGDVKLLAMTLIHHIENNPGFNQFITAVVGSFLAKNPEEEKKFLEGLEIMKKAVGLN